MMNRTATKTPSIRMGEMDACVRGCLRSLLGSCIGLALYDPVQKIGGLAHIVLPKSREGETEFPGKYADSAIPLLIERVQELAKRRANLSAKIAGGANMFATANVESIGAQNLLAIERLLKEHHIPVRGRHCGGTSGRQMMLDTSSGQVSIEIIGAETVIL